MSSINILGMLGTGGIGVLAVGLIASKLLNLGFDWLFGTLLFVFVLAGAIALLMKSR